MEETDTAAAVRRAQAGDREAFALLVQDHAAGLVRLAAGIVGAGEAGDLAQETFVAAWQQLPRLRKPAAFPGWLRRICVNRCRNALRDRRRRPQPSVLTDAHEPAAPGDFREPILARDALDGAFDGLSAEQRAVVVLHYGMGHSLAETATLLGIRAGTYKSRLNAALGGDLPSETTTAPWLLISTSTTMPGDPDASAAALDKIALTVQTLH